MSSWSFLDYWLVFPRVWRFDLAKYPYAIGLIALMGIIVYGTLDPAVLPFPRCPFLTLTGWMCPGCGSQRAIHQALQGNLMESMRLNPLFIPGISYVLFGYITSLFLKKQWMVWRDKWYGKRASIIALVIILAFWVGRNLLPSL